MMWEGLVPSVEGLYEQRLRFPGEKGSPPPDNKLSYKTSCLSFQPWCPKAASRFWTQDATTSLPAGLPPASPPCSVQTCQAHSPGANYSPPPNLNPSLPLSLSLSLSLSGGCVHTHPLGSESWVKPHCTLASLPSVPVGTRPLIRPGPAAGRTISAARLPFLSSALPERRPPRQTLPRGSAPCCPPAPGTGTTAARGQASQPNRPLGPGEGDMAERLFSDRKDHSDANCLRLPLRPPHWPGCFSS